jgi:hypothetical protein
LQKTSNHVCSSIVARKQKFALVFSAVGNRSQLSLTSFGTLRKVTEDRLIGLAAYIISACCVAGGGGEGRGPGRGTLQDVGQRLLQRGREQEEGRQGQGRGEELLTLL